MKLKQLESLLQDVQGFQNPQQELEQYITQPRLAAAVTHAAEGDISRVLQIAHDMAGFELCSIVDLGCGTGMLSIACALLGAPCVLGVDIDEESLATAAANVAEFEGLPIELIQADVAHLSTALPELRSERGPAFDVAVCNPPFGAWVKGADTAFLATAFKVTRVAVYSLHKRSTRSHILRYATRVLGAAEASVMAELQYDLPATYKHHRKKSKDIDVDLWRFSLHDMQ